MSVVTQLYFQFVEENNYMFQPFSGWAIIRLRLEHQGKLILQCGYQAWGTRSRFTMFGEECSYIYVMWTLMFTTLFVVSSVSSTRGLESSLNVSLESVSRSVLGWVGFISDCCGEDSRACEVIVFKGGLDN
jgi:hypothetical protein